jgi:hypothetical protein
MNAGRSTFMKKNKELIVNKHPPGAHHKNDGLGGTA